MLLEAYLLDSRDHLLDSLLGDVSLLQRCRHILLPLLDLRGQSSAQAKKRKQPRQWGF
jgi:hypothetical protein